MRNKPKSIDEGFNINMYAIDANQTFAEQKALRHEKSIPSLYNENHNTIIIAICKNWSARNVESDSLQHLHLTKSIMKWLMNMMTGISQHDQSATNKYAIHACVKL